MDNMLNLLVYVPLVIECILAQDYRYPPPEQIVLPVGTCGDEEMYNAVQNVLDKLSNLRSNHFRNLASSYETIGVNISSTEDVRRLACFMSDIRSVEQMAQLYVGLPVDSFVQQFHNVAPYLKMLSPDTIRQGLLFIRKIIKWNEKTGFPHLPLMETTYVDTWQFFTELQNQLPEALVDDIMAFYNAIYTGTVSSPLTIFFTTPPEKLARLCHDANNDREPLYSLFDNGSGYSQLNTISKVTRREFSDLEHIYTPFAIAVIQLESVIYERGWFDF